MKFFFAIISSLVISLSAVASQWLYYKHYPWVYDNASEDWLYLRGAENGTIYAYSHSTKEWEEFTAIKDDDVIPIPIPTWEQQYEEWIQNPEPYGGLSVLQQIKGAKDRGDTSIDLMGKNISDISPLAGLTNLTSLVLFDNNISDLSPLEGLSDLTTLDLFYNNISDIYPLEGLINLTELSLTLTNISDISPLAELTNLTTLKVYNSNIFELSPLAKLKNLTNLQLGRNSISDLTPLAGLLNLTELELHGNNISDLSPLEGLSNLTSLSLYENNISASQKSMLEEALPLPNTVIYWQL